MTAGLSPTRRLVTGDIVDAHTWYHLPYSAPVRQHRLTLTWSSRAVEPDRRNALARLAAPCPVRRSRGGGQVAGAAGGGARFRSDGHAVSGRRRVTWNDGASLDSSASERWESPWRPTW